ncbi:hypothetical protein [Cytobacillus purgationiresistens]
MLGFINTFLFAQGWYISSIVLFLAAQVNAIFIQKKYKVMNEIIPITSF